MAAVNITISGVLCDKYGRTIRPVTLVGEATLTGLGVGGGPVVPPGGDHIWGGPIDPYPDHGLPGPQPPTDAHPEHPIVLPPDVPPPEGPADDQGFIKPPPVGGGWAYHETYGWMLDPKEGSAQPK